MYLTITYLLYLSISAALTIWVAQTLYKNGEPFLIDALNGDKELAHSVNHLLVVGFYLINLGYIALMIKAGVPRDILDNISGSVSIEILSVKLGLVMLILGAMHFFNLYVLARIRKQATLEQMPPPIQPSDRIA